MISRAAYRSLIVVHVTLQATQLHRQQYRRNSLTVETIWWGGPGGGRKFYRGKLSWGGGGSLIKSSYKPFLDLYEASLKENEISLAVCEIPLFTQADTHHVIFMNEFHKKDGRIERIRRHTIGRFLLNLRRCIILFLYSVYIFRVSIEIPQYISSSLQYDPKNSFSRDATL